MSTKSTIRYGEKFHLYVDAFDKREDDVVHLELEGIEFSAHATNGGAGVEITMPSSLAVELGLIVGTKP